MKYADLRDFLSQLEARGELQRIRQQIDPRLEMTEICDRTLKAGGPALLFENPTGHSIPVLANLFGTPERVAHALGQESVGALRDVGRLLAFLKEPEPPKGFKDLWDKLRTRPVNRWCSKARRSIWRNSRSRPAGRTTPGHSSPGASPSPGARARSGRTSVSTASR